MKQSVSGPFKKTFLCRSSHVFQLLLQSPTKPSGNLCTPIVEIHVETKRLTLSCLQPSCAARASLQAKTTPKRTARNNRSCHVIFGACHRLQAITACNTYRSSSGGIHVGGRMCERESGSRKASVSLCVEKWKGEGQAAVQCSAQLLCKLCVVTSLFFFPGQALPSSESKADCCFGHHRTASSRSSRTVQVEGIKGNKKLMSAVVINGGRSS